MGNRTRGKRNIIYLSLYIIAATILIYVLNYTTFSIFSPSKRIPPAAESDFALMAEAWNTIGKVYVARPAVQPRTLTYGAISGMVDALGDTDHSTFLTPEMLKEQRKASEGRYKGVGIELRMVKGRPIIVAPMDGSPAQKAGLRSGEIITAIDGHSASGLNLVEIVNRISGPEGTRVRLVITDADTELSREVVLTRADIMVNNVRWTFLQSYGVAHVRIAGFSKGVTGDIRTALEKIKALGSRGVILDLRDDPGGLLDEAIGCTSQFLAGGNVLLEKNAAGKIIPVAVRGGGVAVRVPLVVLVNSGTASAAEIMAGAFQDHGRAKLVGKKTFGTGTVLGQFNLSDGSALMLAVEEWLTPKGHSIWHTGITPDLDVALPPGVRPLLPEEERNLTPQQLSSRGDAQLLAALRLLSGSR